MHITPQIGRAQGFAVGPDNVNRFESPAPYPAEDTPSQATLQMMKQQTDQVGSQGIPLNYVTFSNQARWGGEERGRV